MAQAKEVRGPGPRMGGPRPKVENPGKLLKRIMDEVFRQLARKAQRGAVADARKGRGGRVGFADYMQ